MAFVARLPPLQPKVSAKLTLLAAGNGSLFAGPAVNGGLLQWGRPEGNLRRPLDVEGNGPQGQAVRVGMLGRLGGQVGPFCCPCCIVGSACAAAGCWTLAAPAVQQSVLSLRSRPPLLTAHPTVPHICSGRPPPQPADERPDVHLHC